MLFVVARLDYQSLIFQGFKRVLSSNNLHRKPLYPELGVHPRCGQLFSPHTFHHLLYFPSVERDQAGGPLCSQPVRVYPHAGKFLVGSDVAEVLSLVAGK